MELESRLGALGLVGGRAVGVLAFRAMLQRRDPDLTPSKWKEGRGWMAAAFGGGASVVWPEPGLCLVTVCRGQRRAPSSQRPQIAAWVPLLRPPGALDDWRVCPAPTV